MASKLFDKLVSGLSKTRDNITNGLNSIFTGFSNIDEDFYEELEEILIMSDIGVQTTEKIIDNLREQVKAEGIKEPSDCKDILIQNLIEIMDIGDNAYDFENEKSVLMVIGVNGVGKTTTIGKLASQFKSNDKKVVLAGADTFRAAAGSQLEEWASRAGVDIVSGAEGADPGSVLFKKDHKDVRQYHEKKKPGGSKKPYITGKGNDIKNMSRQKCKKSEDEKLLFHEEHISEPPKGKSDDNGYDYRSGTPGTSRRKDLRQDIERNDERYQKGL